MRRLEAIWPPMRCICLVMHFAPSTCPRRQLQRRRGTYSWADSRPCNAASPQAHLESANKPTIRGELYDHLAIVKWHPAMQEWSPPIVKNQLNKYLTYHCKRWSTIRTNQQKPHLKPSLRFAQAGLSATASIGSFVPARRTPTWATTKLSAS